MLGGLPACAEPSQTCPLPAGGDREKERALEQGGELYICSKPTTERRDSKAVAMILRDSKITKSSGAAYLSDKKRL